MLDFSKISSQGLNLNKSDWVSVKFGEVAIKQNKKVDRETTELTRYVKGEHMGSQDLHLRKWGELKDEYLGPAFTRKFEKGDILYGSRRTYLRKVVIAPFEGITSNTTFVIKANEEKIDKRLLPFVMMSEGFTDHSISNSKGSVNPYINWKDIANYKFLLPPKNIQAKLAELLWSADFHLESQITTLSKLSVLKRAIQKEYFIPQKNTNLTPLSEVATFSTGGTPKTSVKEYWENGTIPWLSSGEVHNKRIIKTEKKITKLALENSSAKILPRQCCLIALAGQGKTKGTVAINEIELTTNQSVAAIIPMPNIIEPEYLFHNLDSRYTDFRHITGKQNTRSGLNLNILRSFRVVYHEKKIRHEIVHKIDKLDFATSRLKEKVGTSIELQKCLINELYLP